MRTPDQLTRSFYEPYRGRVIVVTPVGGGDYEAYWYDKAARCETFTASGLYASTDSAIFACKRKIDKVLDGERGLF
jgi:hypothetical protein